MYGYPTTGDFSNLWKVSRARETCGRYCSVVFRLKLYENTGSMGNQMEGFMVELSLDALRACFFCSEIVVLKLIEILLRLWSVIEKFQS